MDTNVGWLHHTDGGLGGLGLFMFHYGRTDTLGAKGVLAAMPPGVAYAKARILLQDMYGDIPTDLTMQMKTYGWVNGYDYFVRPPL